RAHAEDRKTAQKLVFAFFASKRLCGMLFHAKSPRRKDTQSEDSKMKDAVIVSAVRTAVGKAPKGTLRDTRPDDMGAAAIKDAIARVPGLEASEIDDVIMGCAMPEAGQGMNVAPAAAIRAGLPVETSAMTINRFCSSGLQ